MEGANTTANQASEVVSLLKKKRRADFDLAQFYNNELDTSLKRARRDCPYLG